MNRIALFHNLPSGGAKRTLFEQVKRLAERHRIDVFTLSCAEHKFGELSPFVARQFTYSFQPLPLLKKPFRRLDQAIRLANLRRLAKLNHRIAFEIDKGDYEVVYVQPCQFTNSPSILRYLTKPSVFYCQETLRIVYDPPILREVDRTILQTVVDRLDPLPGLYLKSLAAEDRLNLQAAKRILVNSAFSKESFKRAYNISTEVCYHGVDISIFRPLDLKRKPYIISVGALRKDKGFDFILKSLALIPTSKRPQLTIVSNYHQPAEKVYLESLARDLGVCLDLQYLVSDDDLVKLYNQALLTVYAPYLEPFGLVPLESMASGTPVVGVAEGGVVETVIDRTTGLLVERDPYSFAQAVQELINDEHLRDEYGRQGHEYVEKNWSWEAAVSRLELYLKAAI